jgi:hypothetical protein
MVSINAIMVVVVMLPIYLQVNERCKIHVAKNTGATPLSRKELRENSLIRCQKD